MVDSRKLCPTGWHVPSDSEWSVLIKVLDSNANNNNSVESLIAGGKMKDNIDWSGRPALGGLLPLDPQATNSSGFSALPAGNRVSHGFSVGFRSLGDQSNFVSSTPHPTNVLAAYTRTLDGGSSSVTIIDGRKTNGYSVRCIKD